MNLKWKGNFVWLGFFLKIKYLADWITFSLKLKNGRLGLHFRTIFNLFCEKSADQFPQHYVIPKVKLRHILPNVKQSYITTNQPWPSFHQNLSTNTKHILFQIKKIQSRRQHVNHHKKNCLVNSFFGINSILMTSNL